jgi:hypothetical protein
MLKLNKRTPFPHGIPFVANDTKVVASVSRLIGADFLFSRDRGFVEMRVQKVRGLDVPKPHYLITGNRVSSWTILGSQAGFYLPQSVLVADSGEQGKKV